MSVTSGQTNKVVSIASWNSWNLSGEQSIRYQKILNNPNSYDEIININIGNLANSLQDGRMKIDIANSECEEIVYKMKKVEYLSESDYMWYGVAEPSKSCPCGIGDLLLMSKKGEKFGLINFDEDQYNIVDLSGGKNVVVKSPTDNGNEFICNEIIPSNGIIADDIAESRGGGNCDVRVLVLYTFSIASRINVDNTVISHIEYTNNVLSNSKIYSNSLRFKLAAALPSPINEDPEKSMGWLLGQHKDNQEVKDLRTNNDADLVIIYGDRDLMSEQSSLSDYGLAHAGIGINPAIDSKAYGVVGFFGLNNNNWLEETFAHEIAHILGAKHELCNTDDAGSGCTSVNSNNPTPGHAHNVGETTCSEGSGLKTIMYSNPTDNWIPHYSNPQVDYQDVGATGTPERNNAKILKDNACTVANYRSATNQLSVTLEGPHEACESAYVDMFANVQNAPGPYQYEWRMGDANGINFGDILSTDYSLSLTLPTVNSDAVTFQVKVTAGDGSVEYAWKTIEIVTEDCNIFEITADTPNNEVINNFKISPNPAIDFSTLDLEVNTSSKLDISIQNYDGTQLLKVAEKFFEKGIHIVELNTSSLQSGIYFIKINTEKKVYTEKLLIFK